MYVGIGEALSSRWLALLRCGCKWRKDGNGRKWMDRDKQCNVVVMASDCRASGLKRDGMGRVEGCKSQCGHVMGAKSAITDD